jgi:hypothetical protein
MENIEVLIIGKLVKLGDCLLMQIDDKQLRPYTPYDCYTSTLNFDANGYFPYEVQGSSMTILSHHPSVRMMTFRIAIEYVESVIESEKKNLEESGDWCSDPVTYHRGNLPYSRSHLIAGFERLLNDQTMRRANYIRRFTSQYGGHTDASIRM